MGMIEAILLTVITAATPLVLASIGELVTEELEVVIRFFADTVQIHGNLTVICGLKG